jgi:hypothetical protein
LALTADCESSGQLGTLPPNWMESMTFLRSSSRLHIPLVLGVVLGMSLFRGHASASTVARLSSDVRDGRALGRVG